MTTDHLIEWIDSLPTGRRAQALAYLARVGDSAEGDILAGQAAIIEATGLGVAKIGDRIAANCKAAVVATEHLAKAAAGMQQIPEDIARQVLGKIDMPGLAKAMAESLTKSVGIQSVAAAAEAATSAVESMAKMHKLATELIPTTTASCLSLTESAKKIITHAENIKKIAEDFGEVYGDLRAKNQWQERGLVFALSALLLVPTTWSARGWIQPRADLSTLDLTSLLAKRGGALQFSSRADGEIDLFVQGGNPMQKDGWVVFAFQKSTKPN